MKKGMKIIVVAVAVLMVFAVANTAFASVASWSCGSCYDNFNAGNKAIVGSTAFNQHGFAYYESSINPGVSYYNSRAYNNGVQAQATAMSTTVGSNNSDRKAVKSVYQGTEAFPL